MNNDGFKKERYIDLLSIAHHKKSKERLDLILTKAHKLFNNGQAKNMIDALDKAINSIKKVK